MVASPAVKRLLQLAGVNDIYTASAGSTKTLENTLKATFVAISNTFGGAGFSLLSVLLIEVVITALFLVVIVSVTSPSAPAGFAPIAIGLALVLFHLVAIPVSNASLNPARSTATAIFGGTAALGSLWLFWVAPILGGVIGGFIGNLVMGVVFVLLYRRWGRVGPLVVAHTLLDIGAFVGYGLLAGRVDWLPTL